MHAHLHSPAPQLLYPGPQCIPSCHRAGTPCTLTWLKPRARTLTRPAARAVAAVHASLSAAPTAIRTHFGSERRQLARRDHAEIASSRREITRRARSDAVTRRGAPPPPRCARARRRLAARRRPTGLRTCARPRRHTCRCLQKGAERVGVGTRGAAQISVASAAATTWVANRGARHAPTAPRRLRPSRRAAVRRRTAPSRASRLPPTLRRTCEVNRRDKSPRLRALHFYGGAARG